MQLIINTLANLYFFLFLCCMFIYIFKESTESCTSFITVA